LKHHRTLIWEIPPIYQQTNRAFSMLCQGLFQGQACQSASERIALPESVGLSGLEHITPAKTAAALLLGTQAGRPPAFMDNLSANGGFGHRLKRLRPLLLAWTAASLIQKVNLALQVY
jgi:hypothetical protein